MSAKQPFNFAHDGDNYTGLASPSKRYCSLQIDQMPNLEFRVELGDVDRIALLLPTDKKGRRPTISCSTSEVPILEDAIPAAIVAVQACALKH